MKICLRFCLSLALVVLVSIATPSLADTPSAIDFAKGDIQDTAASCGVFVLKNLEDKHAYSLWVRGAASGACSFKADGLTFHYPSNYGPTDAGTTTLFAFQRHGADVLISWTPGY